MIDSYIVGVEKPHQKIFELALEALELQPSEAIYIGDIFFIDIDLVVHIAKPPA